MLALFLWLRSEANNDRRHFQDIIREGRKDILNVIRSMETEMKDFHYRCREVIYEEGQKHDMKDSHDTHDKKKKTR